MALSTTITPVTVPGSIPGDQVEVENFLPSIYAFASFAIDVSFTVTDDMTEVVDPITSVTCTLPYPGITLSVVDNNPAAYKVRISGTVSGIFTGEVYKFVKNNVVVELPPTTTDSELSIVEWAQPSIKSVLTSYPFVVNASSTINKSLSQYIYWDFTTSLNYFTNFVNASKY